MTREIRGLFLAVVASGSFGGCVLLASAALRAKPSPPPPASKAGATVVQGRALYLQSCAECHAADASGDEGPDLSRLTISDAHIALVVLSGIKGEMPSFQKKFGPAEVAALQAYLGSLR